MELDEEYTKIELEICKRCPNYVFCKNYLNGEICLPLSILRTFVIENKLTLEDLKYGIEVWEKNMKELGYEIKASQVS